MTTTTLIKNPRTLIAAATSNAAGATTNGTPIDLRTSSGGTLTIKLANGGTGPTMQAVANVLIAHDSGPTPTGASAGAVWKTLWSFGGGTSANAVTEQALAIDASVMHLHVQVTGNNGQAVVGEAFLSELTSFNTV